MKLSDLKETDYQLDEILPTVTPTVGGIAKTTTPGATPTGVAPTAGTQPTAGLAGGQMTPMQAAMAKKARDDEKKQLQDQIKAKRDELQDLEKRLTQLG